MVRRLSQMTLKESTNQVSAIIGVVVSEETRPTPAEYTFQLMKGSEVRVGDFVITDGNPRMLGTVSDVNPQHLYFKIPLLVESSLNEDFELRAEAPPSCSWTQAKVSVLGELDESGFAFSGRAPHPGQRVALASSSEIMESLGLRAEGVALGIISSRPDVVVSLDPDVFMNEHIVTFGVTRFGKSYTNAVIIEEFSKGNRPVFIIDPHGEYYSFSIANDSRHEIQRLPKNLPPRVFKTVIYSPPMFREKEERELTVSFSELEPSEIVELTGIEGENQIALVYETVRGLQRPYDLDAFVDRMRAVKKELVLNVQSESIVARLRVLQRGIGVFGQNFNPGELIVPGQITVVNLSGLDLRAQQVLVTTLLRRLFYERQWGNIPPFSVAIDEAQRFAPEGSDPVSKRVIEELVKEGLKFGVNVLAMSQRPTELSPTIRSQAETRIFHRLSESADVNYVTGLIEKASPGVSESITRLSKGEAIIWGGCTNYTAVRMRIRSRQSKHAGRTGALRLRKKVTNGNGAKQAFPINS
jgi:DNA helicase HerA-like ATPase